MNRVAGIILVSLASTFQLSAKDLGIYNGQPTPALAMYAAQVSFAANRCVRESLTADSKGAANLLKYFDRGIQLRYYTKKDPDFVSNYDHFLNRYALAWDSAADEAHRRFCNGFSEEIVARKREGWLRWAMPLNYLRYKFSPQSEDAARRAKRNALVATLAGGIVTTTAMMASGHDAVNAAKASDWRASDRLMEQSRGFRSIQTGFNELTASRSLEEESGIMSVLDVEGTDGSRSVVRCPVVYHFYAFSAPVESEVWTTYQRVSMKCRDPVPDDIGQLES